MGGLGGKDEKPLVPIEVRDIVARRCVVDEYDGATEPWLVGKEKTDALGEREFGCS